MIRQCILSRYLEEQAIACIRMGQAANLDTIHGKEWSRTADVLMELRVQHVSSCVLCGQNGKVDKGA